MASRQAFGRLARRPDGATAPHSMWRMGIPGGSPFVEHDDGRLRQARSRLRDVLPLSLAHLVAPNRWRGVVASASYVANPASFIAREGFAPVARGGAGASQSYRLKTGRSVVLRHGTPDFGVFFEIFTTRLYDLPPDARARLQGLDAPRVLDLGGHIGLFGVALMEQLPTAEILAFEPDPENHLVLSQCIAANGLADRWQARQAAAAAADGELTFSAGLSSSSRVVAAGDAGDLTVAAVDVLPLVAEANVLKMDMEGSEWAVLTDPRFAAGAPEVLVMEYHAHLCPEPDARAMTHRLLSDAGYDVSEIFDEPELGIGMVWGVLRTAPAPVAEARS
jgi:FkbM family methyltransferase